MIQNEINEYITLIKRNRELDPRAEAKLRYLAADDRVNCSGVYDRGNIETYTIKSDHVIAKIEIVNAGSGEWFFGIHFEFIGHSGGGFCPNISQAIQGNQFCNRKHALEYCAEQLGYSADSQLSGRPDLLMKFTKAVEDFCAKELFGATYGLPLFAECV